MKFTRPTIEPVAVDELAKNFDLINNSQNLKVSGITHNAESVAPGDLFVALKGDKTHGAKYVSEAIKNGAVSVLTDPEGSGLINDAQISQLISDNPRQILGELSAQIYGNPSKKLKVFGITGTNGKTTTAWLIKTGLEKCGVKTGLLGTAGITIGKLEIASERTTPEATELQALMALCLEKGMKVLAMEVSSHAIALQRVKSTHFETVGFTNLSQDHLDFHKDMQEYFEVKAELFTQKYSSRSVINTSDDWGKELAKRTNLMNETVGDDVTNDWRVSDIITAAGHLNFNIQFQNKNKFATELNFAGIFNAFNAAVAIAMVSKLDIDLNQFIDGIKNVQIPGRMQPIVVKNAALGIVDYAHSPEAIENVLAALKNQTSGKLIAVIGAGGNRDSAKRPLMGEVSAKYADNLIITDDNPRNEEPSTIRKSIINGIKNKNYHEVSDRQEAIKYAVSISKENDVIAVLGKGHENYQEIAGQIYEFSDAVHLEKALIEKFGN